MSAQAAVFSDFRPRVKKSASQQSVEVSLLDASSWVSEVFQTLTQLEGLPVDWDSYGSEPPQAIALRTARQFLTRVPSSVVPAPTVTAVPGGGLGLHWRAGERTLEIEFLRDGQAEFLKCIGANQTSAEEGSLDPRHGQRELWKWLVGF